MATKVKTPSVLALPGNFYKKGFGAGNSSALSKACRGELARTFDKFSKGRDYSLFDCGLLPVGNNHVGELKAMHGASRLIVAGINARNARAASGLMHVYSSISGDSSAGILFPTDETLHEILRAIQFSEFLMNDSFFYQANPQELFALFSRRTPENGQAGEAFSAVVKEARENEGFRQAFRVEMGNGSIFLPISIFYIDK